MENTETRVENPLESGKIKLAIDENFDDGVIAYRIIKLSFYTNYFGAFNPNDEGFDYYCNLFMTNLTKDIKGNYDNYYWGDAYSRSLNPNVRKNIRDHIVKNDDLVYTGGFNFYDDFDKFVSGSKHTDDEIKTYISDWYNKHSKDAGFGQMIKQDKVKVNEIQVQDKTDKVTKDIDDMHKPDFDKLIHDGVEIHKSARGDYVDIYMLIETYDTPDKPSAKGILYKDGLTVVFKDSMYYDMKPSCVAGSSIYRRREQELRENFKGEGLTEKDLVFNSASASAGFIIGSNVNGWARWLVTNKDKKSIPLKHYMIDDNIHVEENNNSLNNLKETKNKIKAEICSDTGVTVALSSFYPRAYIENCFEQSALRIRNKNTNVTCIIFRNGFVINENTLESLGNIVNINGFNDNNWLIDDDSNEPINTIVIL